MASSLSAASDVGPPPAAAGRGGPRPYNALIEIKEPARIASAFPAMATVRVVNVWATWCVPCVEEMEDLRSISKALGPQVAIVGVSLDDMIPGDRATIKRNVRDFLSARGVAFPNFYYSGKSDALADYLKFNGEIPVTIAFDRTGRELWRRQGRIDRRQTILFPTSKTVTARLPASMAPA